MNGASSDPKSAQPDGEVKSKRGPGRPKGSRSTKKPNSKATGNMHNFSQYPPPPTIPQEAGLHQQHHGYFEFQWRTLNLCAEFYSAAEELIKGTTPLVIAQCYQMGPGAKFDPLAMISEAKRICDSLLANPIQLINTPPGALYTSFGPQPVYGAPGYPTQMPAQAYPATTFATNPYAQQSASTSQENNTPAPVLPNQHQPFVMPLGPPPMAAPPTYTVYPPPRYPATSYYQYPASSAGYYAAAPTQNPSQPTSTPTNATAATTTPPTHPVNPPPPPTTANTVTTTPTMTNAGVPANPTAGTPTLAPANPPNPANSWPTGYNQGQWADDEVARLKQLTEQNRDQKGEIDWDRVIQAWGNTRTRHQILLKATSMGLKESTTRANKRRREADDTNGVKSSADTMSVANLTTGPSESPSQSNTSSPPVATSPAMAAIKPPIPPSNLVQRPPSTHSQHSQPPAQTQTPHIQWALPTSAPTPPQPDQRYFRTGRPSYPSTATKGGVQHQFMYQPAGTNGSGGV